MTFTAALNTSALTHEYKLLTDLVCAYSFKSSKRFNAKVYYEC